MMKRPIRVVVHDVHFDVVVNGRTLAHSEEYASAENARRAAQGLVDAVNTAPMVLEYWKGRMGVRRRVVKLVRSVWMTSHGPESRPVSE